MSKTVENLHAAYVIALILIAMALALGLLYVALVAYNYMKIRKADKCREKT